MKNILHIGIHYNKNRGGGNLRNTRLLEGFKNSQFKLFIISYTEDISLLHKKVDDDNITVYYANSLIKQILYAFYILLFNRIKIIHAHNIRVLFPIQLFFPFKKKILEIHSFHEQYGNKDKIFKYLLAKVDFVIVLANAAKKNLLKNYSNIINEKKIKVLINGIEKDKIRTSKHIDKNSICVGYIGSFYKWQGIYNFVEMVHILVNKFKVKDTFRFIMVGSGIELEAIRKTISKYKLDNIIELTGAVSPDLVNTYWDMIDIVAMPRPSTQATETTIPLKLMDAICANKIIVASRVRGLTELLNDDVAILYEEGDVEAFAQAVLDIVDKPELIETLKANLTLYCNNMSDWETQNKKLQEIYHNA